MNDALTGVVWRDDSQVMDLHVVKHLGINTPDVCVFVQVLEDEA